MSDDPTSEGLRARISRQGEDALGKLAQDLLENPLVTGALSRAFEAREKATQAQEVALGALNLPSAADLERLTRRLRSVSQRLEGIEDGFDRLEQRIGALGSGSALEERLAAIERKLGGKATERRLRAVEKSVGALGSSRVVEEQVVALAAELAQLREALPSATEPVPREQERLDVKS